MIVFIGILAAVLVACDIAWSRLVRRLIVGRTPLMALVCMCVVVAFALLPRVAAAADVVAVPASTDSQVWFGNILTAVLTACAAPIAAVLCGALWRLASWVGVKVSADDQIKLTEEARIALTQAIVAASPMIAAKGWDHVDVHNKVLADALNFFLQRFPDRASKIAIAAGAPVGAAVTQTLMARLPDAMSQASASPATPPVDPPKPAPQVIVEPTAAGAAA